MLAATIARQNGYDQVLWTDAFEHKWLQEVGMMNVFFIINGVVVTPSLDDGCILVGVTRSSAITLLQEMGLKVEERKIHIDELLDAYKKGVLDEEGHLFLRNEPIEVCTDTASKLMNPPYKGSFVVLEAGATSPEYSCCAPGDSPCCSSEDSEVPGSCC